MITDYKNTALARDTMSVPPLPLTENQVHDVTALLEDEHPESDFLLKLLRERIEPGVGKGARVKAEWLEAVALGKTKSPILVPQKAIELLGTMGGGYNVAALVRLLEVEAAAADAAQALKGLIKVYEAFDRVAELAKTNSHALAVVKSWAAAEWFTASPAVPVTMHLTVYKVDGEINTDDFSPGNQAQSRADIPLHATFFGKTRFPGGIEKIAELRKSGHSVAFTGDVVGTGSSRKSAINSLAWHIGDDIAYTPNKRRGGVVLGSTIAPIFYATARDAGTLALAGDVRELATGEEIILDLTTFKLTTTAGKEITLDPPPPSLLDEYRAGGRLNLIIGRSLTAAACKVLGLAEPQIFVTTTNPAPKPGQGYTLAQKMIGRACGLPGVLPGTVCQPRITTVGSQDTTGPMTMQEIEELACLRFKAPLFMQSFCHTAAYPKKSDLGRWQSMGETAVRCGGVALKPGDGVIHPWLNRMLVPDTVGTGGDSHTRFPLGISFPAGSGLVAFAAALGFMPLEMPPSVLVRFTGKRLPGITVRDMVNAIPYFAIEKGLLTVAKKGKKNIFAGTVLEIEGVDDLSVEEVFEVTDASAERNAAACTAALPLAAVVANVTANVVLLRQLLADGYTDADALARRIEAMENWLKKPELLRRDNHAEYLATLEIDLTRITEPLLACPNDPDDIRPLSAVAGAAIDESFIGSCMTHLAHMKNAAQLLNGAGYAKARMWLAPSTRMDRDAIKDDGSLATFAQAGCRVEIPGCSLCMGNQARVQPGSTVFSTSTRNFDNRLGDGAQVYLGSTEMAAIAGLLGRLPSTEEYFQLVKKASC
ncbi:MAG: bifunctional aconitate hydratase 2/2-methylisocitrate dehydratase [Desulforhopalus sp.]|nr:bifunctional aconitate hydratase 2/2-methylisocitrate dehydratase [Desulforhopalus sp.]